MQRTNLLAKYNVIKYLSFALAELGIPIGTYAGFLLGTGTYHLAGLVIFGEMVLGFLSWCLWARCLEMMTGKQNE